MNDEFMHQFYEEPHAEFADALYERISQSPQPRFPQTIATKLTFRNAAVAFVFLLFVAACVYAVIEKRWDKVGNIWVDVQRTLKFDNSPPPGFTPPTEEPEIVIPDCVSLNEAKEIIRFDLGVPTWIPEGFTFTDKICGGPTIDPLSDFAGMYWEGPDKYTGISIGLSNQKVFNMSTQEYEISNPVIWTPVAPGSYEEVQVKGQSAVLIHGDWEAPWGMEEQMNSQKYEFEWDKKRAIQLYWVDGEVFYHLYTQADLSPEDVIKIAESVQ
jgi:hypothetical protein